MVGFFKMQNQQNRVIVLFSGGLDSLLAAKLLEKQGLSVHCLHAVSPFFGNIDKIAHWRKIYNLDITALDVSEEACALISGLPNYGFGKVLNPCVDCKILLLKQAKAKMQELNAIAIATGEVIGQRPMSQRRDTLYCIRRDANLQDDLIRPLSALLLPPTKAEEAGLIDRSQLLALNGRGRLGQLRLAAEFNLAEIPSPAGGCRLTERESARRYWSLLNWSELSGAEDFYLANLGRQFWYQSPKGKFWLIVGRNAKDNENILARMQAKDLCLEIKDYSSPLALARYGTEWPDDILQEALALVARYSPQALKAVQDLPENQQRLNFQVIHADKSYSDLSLDLSLALPLADSTKWQNPETWEAILPQLKLRMRQKKEHSLV